MQLLSLLYNPAEFTGQPQTTWGQGIPWSACIAVYQRAKEAYGDEISLATTERDDYIFNKWLRQQITPPSVLELTPEIVDVIVRFRYTPLPLAIECVLPLMVGGLTRPARRTHNPIEHALFRALDLAPFMRSEGELPEHFRAF